jgi:hypothetical protein
LNAFVCFCSLASTQMFQRNGIKKIILSHGHRIAFLLYV